MQHTIERLLKWECESRGRGNPKDELRRERVAHHLITLGDIGANCNVLSIGSGTGYYELVVKRYTDDLHCLDIRKQALQICKGRGFTSLIRASSLCLPFRHGVFDCVYALSLSPIGGGQADVHSRDETIEEMKRVARKGGRIVVGHPTTLWKRINGLLRYGNPNLDTFRVSPRQIRESYNRRGITIQRSMILPPIPHTILTRIDHLRFDKILSHLLLDEIGAYLFVCGIK